MVRLICVASFALLAVLASGLAQAQVPEAAITYDLFDALFGAFLGGMLLNIMPCVLPVVIPKIKHLMTLARKSGGGSEKRRMLQYHAVAYSGGVLATLLGLAVVVISLQSLGHAVGWGFQFQSLPFLMFMVGLLFVMGLGMLKVFSLKSPAMDETKNNLRKLRGRAPYLESFLSGLLVTFVGTPCTAPFLGPALGYAFAQPPALILLFFAVVGLGLSFPFLLLGVWTGWTRLLPERFYNETYDHITRGLGFLLFATALWLFDVILETYGPNVGLRVLALLLVLGFGAWMLGLIAPAASTLRRKLLGLEVSVVVVLLLGYGAWVGLADSNRTAFVDDDEKNNGEVDFDWLDYQPDLLAALRKTPRPIFVDFTAKWCANCKANEKLFIEQPETDAIFDKYRYLLVRGDYTDGSDEITEMLHHFKRSGVPLYLVIPPCASKDEQVLVLPEFLSRELLDNALKKAAKTNYCAPKKEE